tara:strand:- start:826 stop:1194 length:369 start_codon:yes stop_codon:yes gene_type:complete
MGTNTVLSQSQRSRSRNGGVFSKINTNGTGTFNSKDGISAQLTPISKKFAPDFASTHSIIANTISMNATNTMLANKAAINTSLVPQQDALLKDLNHLVDKQLQEVVEKINLKKELEKRRLKL